MTKLTSKITGMQFYAYDFDRQPDKNGTPQRTTYNQANEKKDVIIPVTQQPTEFLDQSINEYRLICDAKHNSNGKPIKTHYITTSGSAAPADGSISTFDNYSMLMYSDTKLYGDEMIFSSDTTVTRDVSYYSYTTRTTGINLLYQTGIVPNGRGRSAIVFEVATGYKIPVGNIIQVTPTFFDDNLGEETNGTPQTFPLNYEIPAGIYLITTNLDTSHAWTSANIDFQTVPVTEPIPETPQSTVTFQLSHCTVTPNETSVTNGVHSWTFTADEGYTFKFAGGIMDDNLGEVGSEIPATNTNVTSLNDYNVQRDITIVLTAYQAPVTTIPFEQTLTHVRSNVTSTSISRNLNAISLTADTGYIFQTSIQILFYSGGQVVSEYNVDGNNTDSITIPLNTNTENTITSNMDKVQITASAILATSHAGYEHNYLITDTELNSFSNEKLWKYADETLDVSKFIDNLIELPFKVETPTTVNKISVGNVQSDVVAHETEARFVTLDLGTINVPAKYNNGYDYQNRTVKLYTPFVDPITITNENAIDKTIHIVYKIDISNGDLTVNLYNDNVLFFTGTNNIASELPFLNTVKNTVIKNETHFNDNDIRKPYLVVTRETPILDNDYYPTIERGLIKNYNGNVQVRLLNNMNIPNNELSELKNQLESGVQYVKSN